MKVSIPLWFDSNWVEACGREGYLHRVSIPLWFDSNRVETTEKTLTDIVSIPLWFDSNLFAWAGSGHRPMFQFHSGSIQTQRWLVRLPLAVRGFNSTLVRFKRVNWFVTSSVFFSFNSTLVRFKLTDNVKHRLQHRTVSIPLWFDSNCDVCLPLLNRTDRFNSTLVRFKHFSALIAFSIRLVSIPLWFDSNRSGDAHTATNQCTFQFHSGSIQTSKDKGCYTTCWKVSIPLWFDSNLFE